MPSRHASGGLTIYEGTWAYCDGAGADEGHRWNATGGVALETLVRWSSPNGSDPLPASTSVKTNGQPARSAPGAATTTRRTTGVRRT